MLLYTDAAHGGKKNPVGATAWFLVQTNPTTIERDFHGFASGPIIAHGYGPIRNCPSSSVAELIGAVRGLKAASERGLTSVTVVCDNLAVARGMRRAFQLSREGAENMRPYWSEVVHLKLTMDIDAMHTHGHRHQTFNTLCDWTCSTVREMHKKGVSRDMRKAMRRHLNRCLTLCYHPENGWLPSMVISTR